jgi:Leucine-rich repeat (LRR) protein
MDMNTVDPHHPGKSPGGSWADERSNNFTGTLPATIGDLSNLQWLELNGTGRSGEGLEGAIPSSFGNLTQLKGLHLAFNRLTSLPSSLGQLTNLINLALAEQGTEANPSLAGHGFPQWVEQLESLKFLWMQNNHDLGGQLPDLSALTGLEIILLDFNGLTGEIPGELFDGTMPNINMAQLAWNNFSGTMPEIREPNNLAAFTIEGNGITGQIPDSWGTDAASSMINFGLGWNELEGEIPDLSHMGRLRYLRANDNNFTGTVPMVDVNNDKLQFIRVQNNSLSEKIPPELAEVGNLPKFRDLNVQNNSLTDGDLDPIINALEDDNNMEIFTY